MRKLLVYPIPASELFTLEVLLRISTGVEMCLLMVGAGLGLLFNPKVPLWAPLSLVLFVVFNLCCSAGIRDLLVRLLARKRIREVGGFPPGIGRRLATAILISRRSRGRVRRLFSGQPSMFWPWTAAARLSVGEFSVAAVAIVLAWTAAAYLFGRWQFARGPPIRLRRGLLARLLERPYAPAVWNGSIDCPTYSFRIHSRRWWKRS